MVHILIFFLIDEYSGIQINYFDGPIVSNPYAEDYEKIIHSFRVINFIRTNDPVQWKTYRNEKYGFEIKYPQDLIINENSPDPASGSGFTFTTKNYYNKFDKSVLRVYVLPKNSFYGLSMEMQFENLKKDSRVEVVKQAHTLVDGLGAEYIILRSGPPTESREWYIAKFVSDDTDQYFQIEGPDISGALSLDEFLMILSSFNFIK
ncbi:MAG: hypothetical protein A2934_02340 [Candidatus Sungbacteria bacterium RIFCSPLOWO2_01_FULL_47_10]|uniref:Uncharacterized protein n=1 Tax=Candidatus Sungbacteria bacterium RIFCSPLOWO2_01_FULL_47_10 TaxID=1802276 RepID=A0A1G2L8I7_9BACT|nr:MAG: hypothetical protein A2934_02340 [Candidatus Sungbacteria bacterium RIFCSPLOWO2_01_FULL_47_10]